MVYLSQFPESSTEPAEIPKVFEPEAIKAARKIYRTYCSLHGKLTRIPIGVAVDPKSQRGQLLFTKAPILLPGELFIPLHHLESAKN